MTNAQDARVKEFYETDFKSANVGGLAPELRIAAALEYAAFQLGQINRKMDKIIAANERLAGSQPDPRPYSTRKAEKDQGA